MKAFISATFLALILSSILVFEASPVWAVGTTYIRADGSVDPPTAPIQRTGDVYTLTGEITCEAYGIVIEKDNIVLDGAGHTVQGKIGFTAYDGVRLYGRDNITIKNLIITTFYDGIYVSNSSDNIIWMNEIRNCTLGIRMAFSPNNNISANVIVDGRDSGIEIESSSNNSIIGNFVAGFEWRGIHLDHSSENILSGNDINNNGEGIDLDSSDYNNIVANDLLNNEWSGISFHNVVVPASSNYNNITGNTIKNSWAGIESYSLVMHSIISMNNISGNREGIDLSEARYNEIANNNITNGYYGIRLMGIESNCNSIVENNITSHLFDGVNAYGSSINNISKNNIVGSGRGITLYDSLHNSISENKLTLNGNAIVIGYASNNNTIVRNNVTNSLSESIYLHSDSIENNISENTVTNSSCGVYVYNASNNTILGNRIEYNENGIYLDLNSNQTNISENNITNNDKGIKITSSTNNVSKNTISYNPYGIELYGSKHNRIIANKFIADGLVVSQSTHNTVEENLVNGKALVYLEDVSDYAVSNAGQVILINCTKITVENLNLSKTTIGLALHETMNCTIRKNTIAENNFYGIWLSHGSDLNDIAGNNITNNSEDGIYVYSSSNNIAGNDITYNRRGIFLYSCSDNTVYENRMSYNDNGISLSYSSNSLTIGNSLTDNEIAITLFIASNNNILRNNVANNNQSMSIISSSSNYIYHNNFKNNIHGIFTQNSLNIWDDGYPSGGNYWSDYTVEDFYSGPYQNVTGSDGIGDSPYIIDVNNTDPYPFKHESGWRNNTELEFSMTPNPAYVGQTVTIVGNLTDGLGQPINNTKIDLFVNGALAGNMFTNSSGWFQASSKVSMAGTYNVTAYYYGSQDYNPSAYSETLNVYPKLNTKVSFNLSPNPSKVGQTVTMLGNLTDSDNSTIPGAPLEVYLKIGAGQWQYMATIYTDSSGWFNVPGKVTSPGIYQVAVLYRGSYKYNLSYRIETLVVNS